jgi:hypothetical protein
MHRTFVGILGAAIVSVAMVSAQDKSAPPSGSGVAAPPAGKPVTYVGCLEPGTGENNFTLTNAQEKGNKDKKADHLTFKVVAASDKVNLEDHVTQAVTITGTFADSTPLAGQSEKAEKLATLTATSVKYERDYCGRP